MIPVTVSGRPAERPSLAARSARMKLLHTQLMETGELSRMLPCSIRFVWPTFHTSRTEDEQNWVVGRW